MSVGDCVGKSGADLVGFKSVDLVGVLVLRESCW